MHLGRDPAKRVSEWQALLASAGLILVLQVKPRAHLLHWIWEFVQKKKKKKSIVCTRKLLLFQVKLDLYIS